MILEEGKCIKSCICVYVEYIYIKRGSKWSVTLQFVVASDDQYVYGISDDVQPLIALSFSISYSLSSSLPLAHSLGVSYEGKPLHNGPSFISTF